MFKQQRRLLLDTVILGIIGALSAQVFTWMLKLSSSFFLRGIAGYQSPGLPEEGGVLIEKIGLHGLGLIPLVTGLGGLISGLLVFNLAPEAEGHGTDTAVKAYHHFGGFIRARVPFVKMVASAITIGSGGAAGREGPTALITAGIGSIYATFQKRPDEERRLLVLIGAAAGLSAIFRSPIGTAFFVIEVLYSNMEFDAGALVYTMLASAVAYAVNGLFVGWQPLFHIPDLHHPSFWEYPWYLILGVSAGLIATILPFVFYSMRDLFRKIPVPTHFKPAIGGVLLGLLALVLPQVLGGGYGWIQEAMDDNLALSVMIILIFAKLLAFSFTISSGGSGGVFAPCLFVGAMLGGALAQIFNQSAAAFVVVGMGAVFAGAAHVPVAAMLMVAEMTGGYHLLVATSLAVMISYIIQVNLSRKLKYNTLYEAQVPARQDSPAHQIEHLEMAIRLLADKHVRVPDTVSHLDLRTLIASGIPIDLPDNKRLVIGVLKQDSPCSGSLIRDCFPISEREDLDLIAIIRGEHTILPHPSQALQPGDRVLAITTPAGWNLNKGHFTPLS